ncbi:hypothetical protein HCN44_008726 [Aphidius gifuensis]|uniref:Uncharacterized protein n=1 Tax=Aphidius gifuensis TaxID=684658 RepID=A0A834XQY1_APHGI|nr:hypothetical protein HCN44_008726 [Aphidius gifuensis]
MSDSDDDEDSGEDFMPEKIIKIPYSKIKSKHSMTDVDNNFLTDDDNGNDDDDNCLSDDSNIRVPQGRCIPRPLSSDSSQSSSSMILPISQDENEQVNELVDLTDNCQSPPRSPVERSALPLIQAGNLTPQSTTDSWKKDMFSDDDHEDLVATINLPSTSSSSNTNTPAVNSPSKSVTDVDDTVLTDDDDDDEYSCVSDHSSIPPLHRRKILRPISPSDSEISCLTDMLAKCTSPSSSNTNTPVNSPCESVTDVDDTVLTDDDDDDEDNCESDHSSIPPLQRRAILKPISPSESEISSLTDMLAKCTSPSSSNTNTPVNSPCKSVTGVDDTVLTDDDDDDEDSSGSNDTAIPLHRRTISRPIRPSKSEICNLTDSMAKCTSPSPSTSNTNTPVNSSNNSYSNSTTTNVSSQTTHENDHDDGKDKFIPYKIKPTPWSPSNINFIGYNELTATRSSSFIESKPFNNSQSQSSDQQSSIDIQKKNINTCSNQKRLCKACGRKGHGTKFSQRCIKNVDNIPLAKRLEKTKLTQANKIDKIKNSKSKEAKALRQFNYQKKKRVGKLKSGQQKFSTIKSIKMSLNRIIKNQEVKKIIIDDIKVLSKLFKEFSYFVSFCFNHEQNEAINDIEKLTNKKEFHLNKYLNKLTYFRTKKRKKEEDFIDKLFKEYQIIRNEVGMPIEGYCGDLRTNLISMNLINFETNFMNNIIVNCRVRIGNKDKEERYLLTSKALLHKSGHYTRQFVIKKLIKNVEKEKKQVYDQFVEIKKQEFENIVGEIEAEYIKKRKTKKERKQLKQQKIENNTKHDDDGKTRNWKKCKQLLKNKKNNNVVPSESAEPAPSIEPLEPTTQQHYPI